MKGDVCNSILLFYVLGVLVIIPLQKHYFFSLMDIILAVESVWVALAVLYTLDLDSRVEDLVLSSAHVSDCGKRLQWLD